MTTEDKVREAFEKEYGKHAWWNHPHQSATQKAFAKGYMALLNELEPVGEWNRRKFYCLPEGVEKP